MADWTDELDPKVAVRRCHCCKVRRPLDWFRRHRGYRAVVCSECKANPPSELLKAPLGALVRSRTLVLVEPLRPAELV
jgi:hypothetical protein